MPKIDPAVRRDGTCSFCRGERPWRAVAAGDPFCKARCCRGYHRVKTLHGEENTQRDGDGTPLCPKHGARKIFYGPRRPARNGGGKWHCLVCNRESVTPERRAVNTAQRRAARAAMSPEQKEIVRLRDNAKRNARNARKRAAA